MPTKPSITVQTLSIALNYLMDKFDFSEVDVAKRAGVAPKTVNNMRNGRTKATIENTDKVAQVFGMHGWQILIPGFPMELLGDKDLADTIKNYAKSDREGRETIAKIAEREARYNDDKKAS